MSGFTKLFFTVPTKSATFAYLDVTADSQLRYSRGNGGNNSS
jgi:hypothetical protein